MDAYKLHLHIQCRFFGIDIWNYTYSSCRLSVNYHSRDVLLLSDFVFHIIFLDDLMQRTRDVLIYLGYNTNTTKIRYNFLLYSLLWQPPNNSFIKKISDTLQKYRWRLHISCSKQTFRLSLPLLCTPYICEQINHSMKETSVKNKQGFRLGPIQR